MNNSVLIFNLISSLIRRQRFNAGLQRPQAEHGEVAPFRPRPLHAGVLQAPEVSIDDAQLDPAGSDFCRELIEA